MEKKVIEMAALGRALYPGMLYDCRGDSFIPGVTLWDKNALRDDMDVHDHNKTYVKLAASDSLSEKANLLDVSASLKASFFCGLIEVGGSARYMNDTKSSERQCRVTMQFSQTTTFEQLTMKNLGNITYPQVFEQKTATHVVTAVLYGASAFMVFDYTAAENESKRAIEGNLHAVVKKIPTISIEGEASVQMNQDEKKLSEQVNVTFYGDYELEENPTTYQEALKACKSLPTLLKGSDRKGVPVTVWLYPLTLLDSSAAKLVREVSLNLVCKTETLLEELAEVERRCNDLVETPIMHDFPDVKDRLLKFKELLSYYKVAFQKALVGVLPGIRGGSLDNKALGDILNKHYNSPFTGSNMNKWLDNIATELYILKSYTNGLKDLTHVTSSGSLRALLFDPRYDVVVSFTFTSLQSEDSYLSAMQDFVHSDNFGGDDSSSFSNQAIDSWITSLDISESMRKNLSFFKSFYEGSKNEERMKFIIASVSDPSHPGIAIQLYQHGFLNDPNFQPVSKPPQPIVEISDGKAILNLSKSPSGETVKFRVEYTSSGSAVDDGKWTVTDTSNANSSFTLTNLDPNEKYWVRYRAISDIGVSEASDAVPMTLQKKLEITVNPADFMPFMISTLRTKIMNSISMSRWSHSTMTSEMINIAKGKNHPIPGDLRPGMAVYMQGVVLENGKTFELNLFGPKGNQGINVVLHMFYDLEKNKLVYNTCRNGTWEGAIHEAGCPLSKGSAFDVFFVMKSEGYEVYINGQRYQLFKHRLSTDNVNFFGSYGDFNMDIFGIIPNWNTSTFHNELKSGSSRQKSSDIQYDVSNPITKPGVTYCGDIPGGLTPGVTLFFQGVIPIDCTQMAINLKNKQTGNIALHINPRMNLVAINSCINRRWGSQVTIWGGPFIKGGAFDIFIVIKPEEYEVIVNGLPFCTFPHRLPVDQVNEIEFKVDVFMNSFEIIEVDDVNIKAISAAEI